MNLLYDELLFDLPILVTIYGEKSDDLKDFLQNIDNKQFFADKTELIDAIGNVDDIEIPYRISLRFICSNDIEQYKEFATIFANTNNLLFYQGYSTLVFVDYSLNNGLKKEDFLNNIGELAKSNIGFVYFNFDGDIAISDKSYLKICNPNDDDVEQRLKKYVLRHSFVDIVSRCIRTHRDDIAKSTFVFLSSDCELIVEKLNSIYTRCSKDVRMVARIYYLLGMVGMIDPESILDAKFPLKSINVDNPWFEDEYDDYDDVTLSFVHAGSKYDVGKEYHMSIDCALRIISLGNLSILCYVIEYIKDKGFNNVFIYYRAFALVELLESKKLYAKAAFCAYNFRDLCASDKSKVKEMLHKELENIKCGPGGEYVYLQMEIPVVLKLLNIYKEIKTHPSEVVKLASTLLVRHIDKLPVNVQSELFDALYFPNYAQLINITIGLSILDSKVIRHPIRIEQCIGMPAKSSSTVFIYNGLTTKDKTTDDIFAVGNPIDIEIVVQNPYSVELKNCIFALPYQSDYLSNSIVQDLQPKSETIATLQVTPLNMNGINISSLRCSIGCTKSVLYFPEPILIKTAKSHIFCLRTDLLDTYLSGSEINFNVWITNTGKSPIKALDLYFEGENVNYDQNSHLNENIHPNKEVCIKCSMTPTNSLPDFYVRASCFAENNRYKSIYEITKPITIIPVVIPVRISSMNNLIESSVDISKYTFYVITLRNTYSESVIISAKCDILIDNFSFDRLLDPNGTSVTTNPNSNVTFIVPLRKDDLNEFGKNFERSTYINAFKEFKQKHQVPNITKDQEEDIKTALHIQKYIENSVNISYQTLDSKTGKLLRLVLPELDGVNSFSKVNFTPIYYFMLNGEKLDTIPMKTIVSLCISFGTLSIRSCSLNVGKYIDSAYGVLWDGMLTVDNISKDNTIEYSVCFTQSGNYMFLVEYTSCDSAQTLTVQANVRSH